MSSAPDRRPHLIEIHGKVWGRYPNHAAANQLAKLIGHFGCDDLRMMPDREAIERARAKADLS